MPAMLMQPMSRIRPVAAHKSFAFVRTSSVRPIWSGIDFSAKDTQEWTKEIESQVRACLTLSDLLEPQVQKLNSCT